MSHFKIVKVTSRGKVMSCNQLLKASILLNRISDDKRMIILDSSCLSSVEAPRN